MIIFALKLIRMAAQEDRLKDIIGHAKEFGFVFPSSEIYDGLSATYDYGQLGAELKNNIKTFALALLIFSSSSFAMKKADFIKSITDQVTVLQVERANLLNNGTSETDSMVLVLDAEIVALLLEIENYE